MKTVNGVVLNWLDLVCKWKLSLFNNCISYVNIIGLWHGN